MSYCAPLSRAALAAVLTLAPVVLLAQVPSRPATTVAQDTEIHMHVGESRLIPAPGLKRIAVGNGQIVSATPLDGRDILLFANGAGHSTLMVWDAAGRVQNLKVSVSQTDTRGSAREIAAFLNGIPNARVSVIGEKVIVEGENLGDRDLAKIEELSKRYPQVVNFASRLGWEKMVMLDVKVVEFPSNVLRDVGLKWNAVGGSTLAGVWAPLRYGNGSGLAVNIPSAADTKGVPIVSNNPGQTTIQIPSSPTLIGALNMGIQSTLNFLVRDGQASILAEPQLSTRNGSKASFLAGGEYPYTVSSISGQTVLFKPYGIKLDIVPQVDRSNMVRALIDTEVSSLDTSLSTSAGPALTTRRTNTEFNVRAGETMVLAGLLSRKTSTTIDKVPFLGDIPVIGALFRSKRFQNDETELVVFVTPTIVDAHTSSLQARVDDATQRLERDAGKHPYLPANEASPPVAAPTPVVVSSPTVSTKPNVEPLPAPVPAKQIPALVPTQTPAPSVALPAPTAEVPTSKPSAANPPPRSVPTQVSAPAATSTAAPASQPASAAVTATRPAPTEPAAEPQRRTVRLETTPLSGLPLPGDGELTPGPYRVNQYDLPLRAEPEFNGKVLRYLPLNASVEVLDQPRKGYFVAVRVGEQSGWVGAQWLRKP